MFKTSKNDVTNDRILSKENTDRYRDNWDRIFGKKKKEIDLEKVREKNFERYSEAHKELSDKD